MHLAQKHVCFCPTTISACFCFTSYNFPENLSLRVLPKTTPLPCPCTLARPNEALYRFLSGNDWSINDCKLGVTFITGVSWSSGTLGTCLSLNRFPWLFFDYEAACCSGRSGMKGPLQKCWESVRLSSNELALFNLLWWIAHANSDQWVPGPIEVKPLRPWEDLCLVNDFFINWILLWDWIRFITWVFIFEGQCLLWFELRKKVF